MKSRWIEYKGKKIFYCAYSNMGVEELQAEVDEVGELFLQQPENSILALTSLEGTKASPAVVEISRTLLRRPDSTSSGLLSSV